MRSLTKVLSILCLMLAGHAASAAGMASHVVLIVWDGMRPDFISAENTPTLWAMARDGVVFSRHHPVYVSSTEVNGTALATGMYPGESTITANVEFRPQIDPINPVEMENTHSVRVGDAALTNRYLAFPTVCEILHANGRRTVVAGSKGVALLHDRAPRTDGTRGVTLFAGHTLPESLRTTLVQALKQFPPEGLTQTNQDLWTAAALTGPLWQDGVPDFSVLWLAEPDASQHRFGPGAPLPLAAIKNDDHILALVLKALKEKNVLDSTDVMLVSDHGFSTVKDLIAVRKTLRSAGLRTFQKFPASGPAPGDVLLVSDGGVVLIYVTGRDPTVISQAVHCLQAQSYTGVVFTRSGLPGTFRFSDAHTDSPYAPDVAVVMRWDLGSSNGAPGRIYLDSAYGLANKGSHGTLCPTEMHNTAVAFGPDFPRGMVDSLPTGNIDIAPTILWILGIVPQHPMSGRVLTEALVGAASAPPPDVGTRRLEASWTGDSFVWRQYLQISEVNGVAYLDEGNGSQETHGQPAAPAGQ